MSFPATDDLRLDQLARMRLLVPMELLSMQNGSTQRLSRRGRRRPG
jgi:hypothetical protein